MIHTAAHYKKKSSKKNVPFLLMLVINALLFTAVFFLMSYVQGLLNSDVKINLTEIVTQNKDVITSKLVLELNNLKTVADQLSERLQTISDSDPEKQRETMAAYAAEKGDSRLFFSFSDGIAVFPDGLELDISGRRYFQRAMKENPNISDRTVSRLDGEDIFVLSVPFYLNGQIAGTVQKQYTPTEMYDICSVSLFSTQGYMYIINSQGYILISSRQEDYNLETDNYFRILYRENPKASKKLEADIQNNKAGFMETEMGGQQIFSAYTPIDTVYDWYLISSVATNAVSPNASIVIKLFYIILCAVVLFFTFSIIYFLYYKNKQHAALERIAFVDVVTHGNTFTKFTVDLQNILNEFSSQQYYLFVFDLDNFKYINNFYGFDIGDRMLRQIYESFAQKLRSNETIARVYGDHFVLLIHEVDENRLSEFFQSELIIDNISLYLSAGLYPINDPMESVNLMMDKANMAAMTMKGMQHKQVAVYSEEFDKQMIYDEQLKRSVEQALEAGEIIPFFQPKVDINSRKLVGAEALARWRSKDGKLIPPCDFIPVCEKTGLIVAVDMTILEKTLQFIKKNLDSGVECVPISVNFSRLHLLNKDFLEAILSKLKQYNVPPSLIELELTETVLYDNYQRMEEFLNEIHENGLQVSMDDFGSGYSSLHMLKDIAIDVLKIDKGFLDESANSSRQRAIFAAIAQMAANLDIKVVVEGVETIENVELMNEFGCSIAQGYYFAKPMDEILFSKIYHDAQV